MSDSTFNIDNDIFSIDSMKNNILDQYDLSSADVSMVKFKNTDKQRAVYKVDSKNNSYCLKKVYFSENELLYVYSALEWLNRHDLNVANLLPTNNHGRYVCFNNMFFILTPWIDAIKCDFDNTNHVISSIKELAKMHNNSRNFHPIKGSVNRIGLDDFYISTLKHFNQLLDTANTAFHSKDKFSKEFLTTFDKNLESAKISLEMSSKINNKELTKSLCHGDYVNKNILFSKDNKVWIIDFDKCKYDYCAHDLAYFMRRLLKRDNTKWNLNIAIDIIKSYNSIHPLTSSDLRYVSAYICFPQKYWKLSRDYYKNIKKCNKNSFLTLLTKSNTKLDLQLDFANKLNSLLNEANWEVNNIH